MLLTKTVKIKPRTNQFNYYREKGYDFKLGEEIEIKVEDLPRYSRVMIEYRCDNPDCNKVVQVKWCDYKDREENDYHEAGDFCKECNKKIRYKWVKENKPQKFEEENSMRVKNIKETLKKEYDVENVMQIKEVQEKFKNNFLEKYGVENPSQLEEVRIKRMNTMQTDRTLIEVKDKDRNNTYYRYAGISVSRAQKHFWDIYGGELNYPVDALTLDLLLEDNIDFEYNGTGHNLSRIYKGMTKKETDKLERNRYYVLKKKGYKNFTYQSIKTDKLPDDKILLSLKRIALEYLKEDNHNWITFDKDNNLIKTKFATIDYNYDKPLTKRILKKLS